MLGETLRIALVMLGRNKLRTTLTSLGILIGVAAVVSMVSLGRGATAAVEADLAELGRNLVFVMPGVRGQFGPPRPADPLRLADVDAIRESVPGVVEASPMATSPTVAAYGDETWTTNVNGSDESYLPLQGWTLARGRPFTEGELLAGADVCILGDTVREELFGHGHPLEERVRFGKSSCRVVGFLAPKGENTFGQDQDDFLYVPIRTFHRRVSGDTAVSMIFVSAAEGVPSDRVVASLTELLRERRHVPRGAEDDFMVRDMKEFTDVVGNISRVMTSFLGAVAAVSLLVGGIGIMNIMTVSVAERTREIGIRLAIGARARDVLQQFLVEAALLAVVGGVVGLVVGVGLTFVAATVLGVPFVVDPLAVGLALGVSGLIGVFFGFFPARRAARLRPIDALRHE